jgi:class 3 adenylate cyclase
MENARLITETREALDQQTATAEVLGVINSSPGELAPVFDAILAKAMWLCDAACGQVYTWDGTLFQPTAVSGDQAYVEWFWRRGPRGPYGDTIRRGGLPRIARDGERLVHMPSILNDPGYATSPGMQEQAEAWGGGDRSQLSIALCKEDQLLGALTVYHNESRPFTGKQIALLQNFAAQAVIAMENARLLTETREALEQQTATAQVLETINSSPGDLPPIFKAMLQEAVRLCHPAFGSMHTFDGERFHCAALHDVPAEGIGHLQTPLTPTVRGGPLERLLNGEEITQVPDLMDSDAYRSGATNRVALVDSCGARSAIWVALRKERRLIGVLVLFRRELRSFSPKEVALLQSFAAQAVIAIENARLLGELRQRTDEVAELNRGLEARVAEQVEELGRVGRLKRFLAPQLAELIVSQGAEKILESHRREIVVVFCDLRGYTAFTETAEPEEVLDFKREYHGALGPLVSQFEGTLDQFSGDGIMVFFNDPVPIPDPAIRAVNMAVAMREVAGTLIIAWRERGRDLGFGAGIAQGYATLGQIGFSERSGYTAIGTVCNVAARLCAEAKDGQILLSQRVNVALKGGMATEQLGALALKGLTQPVVAYNVALAASQPALRVIEGGPQAV